MITTDRLPEISTDYWKYGVSEYCTVRRPKGVDPLPAEWEEKIGEQALEQPYFYEIEDVHLYGPAMVGIKDDVILDTAYYGRLDLWERNYSYFEMAMQARGEVATEIDCAFSACNVWSGNYFHWLLDTLPKLQALDDYESATGNEVTVLVNKTPPGFVVEMLELFNYPYEQLQSHHYHAKKLVVPTNRRQNGFPFPHSLEYLKEMVGVEKLVSPKLYISRKKAPTRRLENEDELCDYLLKQGYACILPEDMSFAEQMGVFLCSESIISTHGAGLANMIWSRNRPKVIEIVTPAYTNPCCWLIAEALGYDYGYVVGEPTEHEDMTVDMDKLKYVIEMV